MNIQYVPLEDIKDVLGNPTRYFQGDKYFRVANSWTEQELTMIKVNPEGFGFQLIRIDPKTRKGLPTEWEPIKH